MDKIMKADLQNVDKTAKSDNRCESEDVNNLMENDTEEVEEVTYNNNLIESQNLSLNQKLIAWNLKHRPSRSCVKDIIEILKEENLVVTPFYKFHCPNRPIVENIAGGSYMHIGMPCHLKRIAEVIKLPKNISIDVNIDGLPLFKSSKTQLWPILIRITNVESLPVFPVGVFVGKSKPATCEEFLAKFIDEFSSIICVKG